MKIILTAILLLFSLTACSSDISDTELKEQVKQQLIDFSKINYEVKKEGYTKQTNDFTAYITVIQDKATPYLTKKEAENIIKANMGFTAAYLAYNDIFLTVENVEITEFKRDTVSGEIDVSYTILLKDSSKNEVIQGAAQVTLLLEDGTLKIDRYWDDIRTKQFMSSKEN
ncbi:hypothetical protein E8L90_18550 [Brevibacillus antibioticus]|uniref:Nuclear transport factor 2 family protein n=1 Tax=Brevibacillus antibioticus TaxID=2570228 RepID=A0A4U2Y9C5_9BACL|nr:hypothetical protein [Brevibacillus antibioticus]TKI57298.1 hypothetical protein E8L90_18550 [Brevibacillus antibioticus]